MKIGFNYGIENLAVSPILTSAENLYNAHINSALQMSDQFGGIPYTEITDYEEMVRILDHERYLIEKVELDNLSSRLMEILPKKKWVGALRIKRIA